MQTRYKYVIVAGTVLAVSVTADVAICPSQTLGKWEAVPRIAPADIDSGAASEFYHRDGDSGNSSALSLLR